MSEPLTGNARVAADLAAAGFSVFPCEEDGPPGFIKKPKPGVFWRSASTTDKTKVAHWWRRWPSAAIGFDLAKSGMLVVDADRHDANHDGVAAIAALFHEHGFDPDQCPLVATPNAGTHYWFRQPPGKALGNSEGRLKGRGINIRGAGGYVLAPGTVMADGRRYEAFGDLIDAPVIPDWLVSLIEAPAHDIAPRPVLVPAGERPSDERIAAYVNAAVEAELEAVRSAPRGGRNNQLNASAFALGQLVGAGLLGEGEVAALLENAAQGLAADDGPASVRKTISSGLRSGIKDPRQMPESEYRTVSAEDYAAAERLRVGMAKVTTSNAPVPRGFDPKTGEEVTTSSEPGAVAQFDLPDHMMRPPGIVGELTDWICEWTAEPIRIHALGAALTIVGTLLGRKVYTRTRPSSTALYVGAIAPSGMGKQHPMDCIRLALDEVCGNGAMHMGWNVSLPAIVVALQSQASKVMIADEFADKLIGLRSRNASTSQMAISEGLRSLWGTNTGTYSPDVSLNRGDNKIMRPALSFYGASTVRDFARSLISKDVTNGLFNRFLLMPRFGEVEKGRDRDGVMSLPTALKTSLQWLNNCLPPMQITLAQRGDGYPVPALVPFDAEAEQLNEANKAVQQDMLRASEQDEVLMLYGRFAEQIKRVATIVACGRSPSDIAGAVITAEDMVFAQQIVQFGTDQFVRMVRQDMVENWIEANRQKVLGVIRTAGQVQRSELLRKVRNVKGKEIDEILSLLKQAECIVELKVETSGRSFTAYRHLRD